MYYKVFITTRQLIEDLVQTKYLQAFMTDWLSELRVILTTPTQDITLLMFD